MPRWGAGTVVMGGVICFNLVFEIPDPFTVLMREKSMILMGVFRNIVGGVTIIRGVIF